MGVFNKLKFKYFKINSYEAIKLQKLSYLIYYKLIVLDLNCSKLLLV